MKTLIKILIAAITVSLCAGAIADSQVKSNVVKEGVLGKYSLAVTFVIHKTYTPSGRKYLYEIGGTDTIRGL